MTEELRQTLHRARAGGTPLTVLSRRHGISSSWVHRQAGVAAAQERRNPQLGAILTAATASAGADPRWHAPGRKGRRTPAEVLARNIAVLVMWQMRWTPAAIAEALLTEQWKVRDWNMRALQDLAAVRAARVIVADLQAGQGRAA